MPITPFFEQNTSLFTFTGSSEQCTERSNLCKKIKLRLLENKCPDLIFGKLLECLRNNFFPQEGAILLIVHDTIATFKHKHFSSVLWVVDLNG